MLSDDDSCCIVDEDGGEFLPGSPYFNTKNTDTRPVQRQPPKPKTKQKGNVWKMNSCVFEPEGGGIIEKQDSFLPPPFMAHSASAEGHGNAPAQLPRVRRRSIKQSFTPQAGVPHSNGHRASIEGSTGDGVPHPAARRTSLTTGGPGSRRGSIRRPSAGSASDSFPQGLALEGSAAAFSHPPTPDAKAPLASTPSPKAGGQRSRRSSVKFTPRAASEPTPPVNARPRRASIKATGNLGNTTSTPTSGGRPPSAVAAANNANAATGGPQSPSNPRARRPSIKGQRPAATGPTKPDPPASKAPAKLAPVAPAPPAQPPAASPTDVHSPVDVFNKFLREKVPTATPNSGKRPPAAPTAGKKQPAGPSVDSSTIDENCASDWAQPPLVLPTNKPKPSK